MSLVDRWRRESPRPGRAELACRLAEDRFWRDERRRLIGTHPDWPDAAYLLRLREELAHVFVLILSRLPRARRRPFAEAFYSERHGHDSSPLNDPAPLSDARALALGAAVVLTAIERGRLAGICDERTLDLLRGAAQRDDLTETPGAAVAELRKAIARIRFDVKNDDPSDPRGAAALALAEVLDPSSEVVDLKEVLARCGWALVETQEPSTALGFLLEVERLLVDE